VSAPCCPPSPNPTTRSSRQLSCQAKPASSPRPLEDGRTHGPTGRRADGPTDLRTYLVDGALELQARLAGTSGGTGAAIRGEPQAARHVAPVQAGRVAVPHRLHRRAQACPPWRHQRRPATCLDGPYGRTPAPTHPPTELDGGDGRGALLRPIAERALVQHEPAPLPRLAEQPRLEAQLRQPALLPLPADTRPRPPTNACQLPPP
jgi:hypothetical protein